MVSRYANHSAFIPLNADAKHDVSFSAWGICHAKDVLHEVRFESLIFETVLTLLKVDFPHLGAIQKRLEQ